MKLLVLIGKYSPFILGSTVPIFAVLLWLNIAFFRPVDSESTDTRHIDIPPGASAKDIADILSEASLVSSSFAAEFILNRKLTKAEISAEELIPAGEYEVSPALSPKGVIEKLAEGSRITRSFIVQPGMTYEDIADSIAGSGLFKKDDILKALTKRQTLMRFRVEASIPEGYILPGKYTFSKPITPDEVTEKLVQLSLQNLKNKFNDFTERANDLYFDKHKILTLASIIEKESPETKLRKKVSAVFHNRYLLGLPLESDAALQYGLKSKRAPSQEDRGVTGPYNTFILSTFPASPICAPSMDSIDAALHPEESSALYFFRSKTGDLVFSNTLSEDKQKRQSLGERS